ncbi:MAG: IS66 family transposase, partial [Planctomycetota bacterium]|nr:IS66 family transposase [Planctomycetota bacterium]
MTVQDPKGKAKPHLGRIWTYIGDRKHPYVFYDY